VVLAGVTVTAVPLVTEILPGVMTPEPLPNTAVRAVLVPASMVVAPTVKLVMYGCGCVPPPPEEDTPPPQPLNNASA
jgi:hypothetical protein